MTNHVTRLRVFCGPINNYIYPKPEGEQIRFVSIVVCSFNVKMDRVENNK